MALPTFKPKPIDVDAIQELENIKSTHIIWKQTQVQDANRIDLLESIFSSISTFLISLNVSDTFETKYDCDVKMSIMCSIDDILEDLPKYDTSKGNHFVKDYLTCFKALITYASHQVEHSETEKLLSRFVSSIKKNRQHIKLSSYIAELIRILISGKNTPDEFATILTSNSTLSLLDLFTQDEHKFEICRWILDTIKASLKLNQLQTSFVISETTLINSILKIIKMLNDSLSLLAPKDDIFELSQLLIWYIDRIEIDDYRQRLDFLTRCRSSLNKLNPVLEYLISQVLDLAVDFRQVEKKRAMRQNFLNGCLAFALVTLPAIENPTTRLDLYLKGSRLALNNMSLSLADYYLKYALNCVESQIRPVEKDVESECPKGVKKKDSLLKQLNSLVHLILDHQDHIDLKHKLLLSDLIKQTSLDESQLTDSLRVISIINDSVNR